jgi:hypothetical protein
MLAIFTAILSLVAFPAVVGVLAAWDLWRGETLRAALAAFGIALLVVVGLATRKRWRRPVPGDLADERPFFARFSTWLWTTLLVPNVLFGVMVLTHPEQRLGYALARLLGAIDWAIQGAGARAARGTRRRRGPPNDPRG